MNATIKKLITLIKLYRWQQLALAVLTGTLFFLFPTALIVTLSVNIMIIYGRIYIYIYSITMLITIYLSMYANQRFIETLKHYHVFEELDYKAIHLQITLGTSVIIVAVYYIIFNFL